MLSLLNSLAKPILNGRGQVIAILAGRPKGETEDSWKTLHDEISQAMTEARGKVLFSPQQLSHRRGEYPALAVGGSFGGGQKVGLQLALVECYLYLPPGPRKS